MSLERPHGEPVLELWRRLCVTLSYRNLIKESGTRCREAIDGARRRSKANVRETSHGEIDQRLDGGIWKRRRAAEVDLTSYVALFACDLRLAMQEIVIPKHRQVIPEDADSALQLEDPVPFSGAASSLADAEDPAGNGSAGSASSPALRGPLPTVDVVRSPLANRILPRGPERGSNGPFLQSFTVAKLG